MMPSAHPFFHHEKRPHVEGDFKREEVALANRNSGLPLEALHHDLTPTGLHYLLIHFDIPYVASAEGWTVRVCGRVREPFEVTLAEIKQLPQKTLTVTLECAGNGRAKLSPRSQSQPWENGAVGTAEWTGTPCGISSNAPAWRPMPSMSPSSVQTGASMPGSSMTTAAA